MSLEASEFDSYVEHPRFGRGPRFTGLNPREIPEIGFLFFIFPEESRIPGTAILANLERQTRSVFPIAFYFDQKRVCKDCHRAFIYIAEEQRHWFEKLHFYLNTHCTRCVECRQKRHGLAAKHKKHTRLFHIKDRSLEQETQLLQLSVELAEQGDTNPTRLALTQHLLEFLSEQRVDQTWLVGLTKRFAALQRNAADDHLSPRP